MTGLHFRVASVVTGLLLVGAPRAALAQDPKPATQTGLYVEALAGQNVAALPITLITRDSLITDGPLVRERRAVLAWADSVIGEALLVGAAEVNWILSEELRRIAKRSAGFVPDPDRMGQAALRSHDLKRIPDPLRSSLRTVMAMAGGRLAFVPASARFTLDEDGAVQVTLEAALADARLGTVVWRTTAIGSGPDAAEALRAAIASFLPMHDLP